MITRATPLVDLTDYSALQDDLTTLLLSHRPLNQVNAVQERKFLLDAAVQVDSLWQTTRNGGAGGGIIVEDVRPNTSEPNTPGPIANLQLGFVILVERNIALGPAGCGLHPEQIEQIIVDLFHLKVLQPYGQIRATGSFGEPATDWISDDTGIYARRVRLQMLNARKQTDTCDTLFISAAAGTVTITCNNAVADLEIWFTTDGSCPTNDGALNPQAQRYTAPFTATAGTVVRALAFAPTLNPSALKQIIT